VISSVSQLRQGDLLRCRQAHYCVEDFFPVMPGATAIVLEADHLKCLCYITTEGKHCTTQITGVSLGYWDIVSGKKENA
jgi:hypothetical protein